MIQPVLFLGHGAPPLLDDSLWVAELAALAESLPKPEGILMISAHWEQSPVSIGATRTMPLIYDFYGFPERYYRQQYPAPGSPMLGKRVSELLGGIRQDPTRGLDHGAYVPLLAMYPEANVPVLQLSLPTLEPEALFELGKKLAPLRKEGFLIIGSGFLTHNLKLFGVPAPEWAQEFERWVVDALLKQDVEALLQVMERAPSARLAHPRTEHLVPLFIALGAAIDSLKQVQFPITGYWLGAFAKRSIR
jgi:4,5-DOPA dioxygenase extradiol